jgi:hypothetical protein
MRRRNHWVAAGLLVVGLGLTACGSAEAEYGEISQSLPVHLQPVSGTDLERVTLTAEAARKLGVRTATVQDAVMPAVEDAGAAPETTVPVEAVIYDKDGNTWVYVTRGARTYERQAVSIDRVDGDTAVLKSGPASGTQVVVVGAQELLGAELGVAGE